MFKKTKNNSERDDSIATLQNYATLVSHKNHKNRLFIIKDMMKCKKLYGCSYEEYYYNRFDTLTEEERNTYITEEKNRLLQLAWNEHADPTFWERKTTLYQQFKNDLKRDYLFLTGDNLKEFTKFSKKNPVFIAKTDVRNEPHQIRRVVLNEHMKPEKVYESLLEKNLNLLETELTQNTKLKELYPKSLNTIQFITVKNKGKVHITNAVIKIGNGSIVNNLYYGGMVAKIDLKTGIVTTPGLDYRDHHYEKHPSTKTKIIDFEIPDFGKLKQYVLNLALKMKNTNYIAWDIAITEEGPVLMDASIHPTWYQFPEFMEQKKGKLPQMELLLGHKLEITGKRSS